MNKVIMLPIRQKKIADKIVAIGLNLNDFIFTPTSNDWFELRYKQNDFYYIKIINGQYTFQPAQGGLRSAAGSIKSWEASLNCIEIWLIGLKENLEIGNPWETKFDFNEANYFDSYQELLNDNEVQIFSIKLDSFVNKLESLKIETSEIKKDIEHIKEMSSKISKKDIMLLLIGNVTGWFFSALIPSDSINTVWQFVKNLFSSLTAIK
ncbi:MAG: hypothetical protein A2033_01065 [Bacteroidetes bacterium GWA2_31_9]|nr:MAG: hypothetical protein A2033_01065 [Bacteroidetes bacterium GWA2_31_9]